MNEQVKECQAGDRCYNYEFSMMVAIGKLMVQVENQTHSIYLIESCISQSVFHRTLVSREDILWWNSGK